MVLTWLLVVYFIVDTYCYGFVGISIGSWSLFKFILKCIFFFTFSGLRQSLCAIYQLNIALWCLLQGQPLQQHLVLMERPLLLRSKLLLAFVSLITLHNILMTVISFCCSQWWSYCKGNWLPNWKLLKGVEWSSKNSLGGKFKLCKYS